MSNSEFVNKKKTELETELQEFIETNFPRAKSKGIVCQLQLLESGVVDSMGLLTIIGFIEEKYNFQVRDEDVIVDNFGSIEQIATYINSRLAG